MKEVYGLVRIFDKIEFAQSFQRGEIFTQKIKAYRRIEDEYKDNRKDKMEGMSAQFDLINGKFIIGDIEINSEDITEPVRTFHNEIDESYALCMYSFNSGEWQSIKENEKNDFIESMKMDERIFNLGGYAVVIINAPEFKKRIFKMANECKISIKDRLVDYVDFKNQSKVIERNDRGFIKDVIYSFQNEYRFVFYEPSQEETKIFKIDDISDISFIIEAKKINDVISVDFGE